MGCNTLKVYELPEDRVTYGYRYFLPYAPEWGSEEICDRRLHELLEFCAEAKIDAVLFYVNIKPGTYYMPPKNAQEQEHLAKWMAETVAPAIREAGVSYQLNFQMLLGASTWDLDMRDYYDWDFAVNQHGQETLGCPCPLSPVFRESMGEMLRLWASTKPDVIWIDDDFRLHNHGLGVTENDFYCFCETHLEKFAESRGRSYSREELMAGILAPGAPSSLRQAWLDFTGRGMTELADWVRGEVQGTSPGTRLALMTSVPDVHSAEGRDWKKFLTALCGEYTPMTRPCAGVYSGTMVPTKNHSLTFRFMAHSMALLDRVFSPGKVEYGPELENTRFTTWCKSVSNTEFVLVLGQLLGCPQITLSMNDLDGSPISDEPATVHVLRDNKSRLQALAAMRLRSWQPEGVAFISDPDSARKVQVGPDAKMQDLGLIRRMEDTLLQVGISAKYVGSAEAAASSDVVVLEGYTAWCPSDQEMKQILSGAVMMDGAAADVLQKRGFGDYLGVKALALESYGIMSEKYIAGTLPELEERRIPHRGMNWYALKPNGATTTSEFIDSMNRYHIGSAIHENSLGGRIAVYAGIGDLSPYGTFGNHARLRWLHGVLRWISRERFCVLPIIPHHGLTLVRSNGDEMLIAISNLGTDVLREITFRIRLTHPTKQVDVLDRSGEWRQISCRCEPTNVSETYLLSVPCNLNVFEWLIVKLRPAQE